MNALTALVAHRFFKQFLIMLAVNQVAASLFRLIGGAARNMIVANVISMLIMMTLMVVNGFILIRGKITSY